MRMLHALLDVLAPPRSLTGSDGAWITEEERRVLRRTMPFRADAPLLRWMHVQHLTVLAAGGRYAESFLLREALHRFKYRGVQALHVELGLLLQRASTLLPPQEDLALCPVPLHWSRRFARGFNQAELLAQSVRLRWGWPIQPFLRRTRSTGAQARRSHAERRDALQGAFVVRPGLRVPSCVVLVDDVLTTGATLNACAGALRAAGAQTVMGLVVAMA